MKFSGLDPNFEYSFDIYACEDHYTEHVCVYNINGVEKSLDANANFDKSVIINAIPDETGSIVLEITGETADRRAFINAVIITKLESRADPVFEIPRNLRVENFYGRDV